MEHLFITIYLNLPNLRTKAPKTTSFFYEKAMKQTISMRALYIIICIFAF